MAGKTQIGVVIGVEGASEYNQAIKNIVRVTKEMESELKAAESAFKSEHKTIGDLKTLKEKLQTAIGGYTQKLTVQKEAQAKMNAELEKAEKTNRENAALVEDLKNSGEGYVDMLKVATEWQAKSDLEVEKLNNAVVDMEGAIGETTAALQDHKNELDQLPSAIKMVSDAWKNASSDWGETLKSVGSTLTKTVTVPLVGMATGGVKAFSDWQSAFTGVRKTVDGTKEELDAVAQGLTDIALSTASSREEVAGVAEIAGQLGIATEDVVDFTRVMVMLGDTTNLSAEDAATSLARVLNITGESTANIDRVGSAVVNLGNNFATSESEIVAMANRLAAGGTLAGLTTQEILGLSAAMSSVGITAEAGGTAMNQTLTQIEKQFAAFSTGGESTFERIAEIAGMSAEQFADAWQNRPAEAVQAFIGGLGSLDEKGESATLVLDELGMAGIRQSNMLKSLGLASEELSDAMQKANEGYDENTALTDEASKRYEDFNTKVNQLKESFKLFMSTIGDTIVTMVQPYVEGLTDSLKKISDWWKGLSPAVQQMIVVVGAIVAAIGPVIAIIGNLLIFGAKIKAALEVLGVTIGAITAPIGGIILAIAGVIAAGVLLIKHWDEIKEFAGVLWENLKEGATLLWEHIKSVVSTMWNGIKQFGSNLMAGIVSFFEKFAARLILFITTTLPNFINNVKNGFSNMKSAVSETISNLVQTVKDKINNMINNAWNWGKDLIGNLVDGIRSKISAVKDAVSNIANSISSRLHFSEPDEGSLSDFHTWMPDMMKGLAKGIDDNLYLVDNAISRVADTLGMGNSVNYGGVVINLNVPAGTNGQQLVSEIETELANRTMRRKAVFA